MMLFHFCTFDKHGRAGRPIHAARLMPASAAAHFARIASEKAAISDARPATRMRSAGRAQDKLPAKDLRSGAAPCRTGAQPANRKRAQARSWYLFQFTTAEKRPARVKIPINSSSKETTGDCCIKPHTSILAWL